MSKLQKTSSHFLPATVLLFILIGIGTARAGEPAPSCDRLAEKVTGDQARLSVQAQVNGFAAFTDIACAMIYRDKNFCAMETISFDSTARVFDFISGAEIEMSTAFFVVESGKTPLPMIQAFKAKEDALRQTEGHPERKVVSYSELSIMKFR